jgi:hypothetical protein
MLIVRKLDGDVHERAAAVLRAADEFRDAGELSAQLLARVLRAALRRVIPACPAIFRFRFDHRCDQRVLRGKPAVEARLGNARLRNDGIHAHGARTLAIEQLTRRTEDAIPHALCRARGLIGRTHPSGFHHLNPPTSL